MKTTYHLLNKRRTRRTEMRSDILLWNGTPPRLVIFQQNNSKTAYYGNHSKLFDFINEIFANPTAFQSVPNINRGSEIQHLFRVSSPLF